MLLHFAKLIFLFVVATICHWAFSSGFAIWGLSVNMLLVFVIALCAFCRPQTGYPVAFLCGLFLDFFSTKLFGYNAFSFTVAALIVYSLAGRLDFEALVPQMLSAFLLTILVSVLNNMLVQFFTASTIWAGWWNLVVGALIGTLTAPLVFMFVKRLLAEDEYYSGNY